MKQNFKGWANVAAALGDIARESRASCWLGEGQRASLARIAERIGQNGMMIADEVGMGKTRIAAAVAKAVIRASGRVAILVPPSLPYQWKDELGKAGIAGVPMLRSLRQYMRAWSADCDQAPSPWFDHDAMIISHAFANWRFGGGSDTSRWALMPELYAQWHLHTKKRLPYGYWSDTGQLEERSQQADIARLIAQAIYDSPRAVSSELADALFGSITDWRRACEANAYRSGGSMRTALEGSVGLGLGVFDLIILDEAHKSRGEESVLSSLLERVIQRNADARCLALSATPVELSVQDWKSTLKRIGVTSKTIDEYIDEYARAVERVRETPTDPATRDTYKKAARAFEHALSAYLIRRDKREDPHVIAFEGYSREPRYAYRRVQELVVETKKLPRPWLHAVCAAESLSLTTRRAEDSGANRLYLTFANGHGISGWLSPPEHEGTADCAKLGEEGQAEDQEEHEGGDLSDPVIDKRKQRAAWWKGVLASAFSNDKSHPLYDHPAILKAVQEIEDVCAREEKVLVFGRFTTPLRALTELLNARAMFASLDAGHPWPQAKLSEDDWAAVQAAERQLQRGERLGLDELNIRLADQYRLGDNQRRSFRNQLIGKLGEGLAAMPCRHVLAWRLFEAFSRSITEAEQHDETSPLAQVARMLQELLDGVVAPREPAAIAGAFIEFVEAMVDRGENVEDADVDEQDAVRLWTSITSELKAPQGGGFASLMYSGTKQSTRRLLQLAFNRSHSFPKVLVAQSMVGREGLNLHKACKTVVLLHHEWNPGVVEQQIGRVDRVGSFWQKSLDKTIEAGVGDAPRIVVRPVVFTGTYDEWNWNVLRGRWDDLRAQLHGVVISPRMAEESGISPEVVDDINRAAPNFRPPRPSA